MKKIIASIKLDIKYKKQFKTYIKKNITCEQCSFSSYYCEYFSSYYFDEEAGGGLCTFANEKTAWCNLWWFSIKFDHICRNFHHELYEDCPGNIDGPFCDKSYGEREQL